MTGIGRRFARFAAGLLVAVALPSLGAECVEETDELASMARVEVVFQIGDGSMQTMEARLAANDAQRQAGFQHICPEVIERERILFDFGAARSVAFHMRNVFAPLDIAFFDDQGDIVSLMRMDTYPDDRSRGPLYSPHGSVRYALEAGAGQLDDLNLSHPATRLISVEPVGQD